MANLLLNINIETMYFQSQNSDVEIKNIRLYHLTSESIDENFINNLYILMLNEKGDWFNFDINYFNGNYYVDINLIFHDKQLGDQDVLLIERIIEVCELFFAENSLSLASQDYNNLDKLDELFSQEGYLVGFHDMESSGEIDLDKLEFYLNEHNLSYEIVNKRQAIHEGGASSGSAELILFIFGTIAQGLTWDIIKLSLSKTIRMPDSFSSYLDNYNFIRSRKIIADRVQEDLEDLVLTLLEKRNGDVFMRYLTPTKIINIVYDSKYNIKKLEVIERFYIE